MPLLSTYWYCIFKILILLVIANGTPVIINKIMGSRYSWPVDKGLSLSDGQRLLGKAKTWRGVCSAVFFSTAAAVFLGVEPMTGALLGALAMVGDLLSSFIKRRLMRTESSRARGLDTVPESLLPLWLLKDSLALNPIDIMIIVGLFFLIEEFISPVLYRLHIRNQPY
ncbi:MAG: CDP-archaeol synthase [Methylococcales bacterium]|nr:CDP-archaeol synthase [Methylococcales bacterium]